MQLLSSNLPSFIYQKYFRRFAGRSWIYLDSNNRLYHKLRKFATKAGMKEIDYARELYEESEDNRKEFIEWIDQISLKMGRQEDWLFSVPSVKNSYFSQLFLHVCYLKVFERHLNDDDLACVITSPSLTRVLSQTFPSLFTRSLSTKIFCFVAYLGVFIRSILRWLRYALDFLLRFLAVRWNMDLQRKKRLAGVKRIVLIRNFIELGFAKSEETLFEKHFFPGLYEYLFRHDVNPVMFPITVQGADYFSIFKKVAASKQLVYVPEEFLKWSDVLYALFKPLSAMFCYIEPVLLQNRNLMRLAKDEYMANLTDFGFLYAHLLSRCGIRMKEAGIEPESCINWFENQSIEKGLLGGLKNVFPDMSIVDSHLLLTYPNQLSFIPSKQDALLSVLPDRMLVLGDLGKSMLSTAVNIPTEFSPAFRYQKMLETNRDKERVLTEKNMMVLTGFSYDFTLHTLRMLINIKDKLTFFDRIWLKLHPASYFSENDLLRALGLKKWPAKFSFCTGKLDQYIDQICVGICSSGTGTAVELVVQGIPTIVVGEQKTLTLNCLSVKEDPDIWQLCFYEDEIVKAVNHFTEHSDTDLKEKAAAFRNIFFAQPQENYWAHYIMIKGHS
jgi:hypothetical protein